MDDKNKFVFDERRKLLTHTITEDDPLFGKEEYGHVVKKTNIISNDIGTVKILVFLESQEKGMKEAVAKTKEELQTKKDALSKLQKELFAVKEAVGTRLNLKKIRKELEEKESAEREKAINETKKKTESKETTKK